MSAQLQSPSSSSEPQISSPSAAPDASSTRSRTVGGIVLVIIGLLLLVAQLTDWNILGGKRQQKFTMVRESGEAPCTVRGDSGLDARSLRQPTYCQIEQ